MKYRIRIFDNVTNKEALTVKEEYESEDAVEEAIKQLKQSVSPDYQYVKVPVK